MQTRWTMAAVLVGVAMLAGCQATQKAGQVNPVAIYRQASGSDGDLKADPAEVTLVTSQEQLDQIDGKDLSQLAVDFQTESLLVLPLGEQPTGGFWVRITSVQLVGNDLWVQGAANKPAADQQVTQAQTHPYAAVVIQKVQPGMIYQDIDSVEGQSTPPEPMLAPPPAPTAEPAPAETENKPDAKPADTKPESTKEGN